MFSKQTKPFEPSSLPATLSSAAEPAAAPARKSGSPRVATVIAEDVTIEGNVTSDGELQVDGVIRGDIRVARISIGETGLVEGAVLADLLEARGRVIGSVTAKQVRLFASAHVDGDITHEQLMMEAGAYFQGRSLKFQRPPATAPIELTDLGEPEAP